MKAAVACLRIFNPNILFTFRWRIIIQWFFCFKGEELHIAGEMLSQRWTTLVTQGTMYRAQLMVSRPRWMDAREACYDTGAVSLSWSTVVFLTDKLRGRILNWWTLHFRGWNTALSYFTISTVGHVIVHQGAVSLCSQAIRTLLGR